MFNILMNNSKTIGCSVPSTIHTVKNVIFHPHTPHQMANAGMQELDECQSGTICTGTVAEVQSNKTPITVFFNAIRNNSYENVLRLGSEAINSSV